MKKSKLLKNKNQYLLNVFILCLIISFTVIYFLGLFLPNKSSEDIATTIAGVLGTAFSFFGSILVYKALMSQIKANEQVRKQFQRENQDQLFFRLIDNLHNRIVNYSVNDNSDLGNLGEKKSYDALTFLVNKIKSEISQSCKIFARQLFSKTPEILAVDYYYKMINIDFVLPFYSFDDAIQIQEKVLKMNSNERWEFIKCYFNSNGFENSKQSILLESIGSVYFYKTSIEMRKDIYENVYNEFYKDYGGFLDGYFNSLTYLFTFLKNIDKKNKNFYIDFLKNNMSVYEKVLLFYFISSNKVSNELKNIIYEYEILNDLYLSNSFFVDLPSKDEFDKELYDIVKYEN